MKFTPEKLTARIVRDLKGTASPVTGNIEYACSIWLDRAAPSARAHEVSDAAEIICAALNRRHRGK